MSPRNGTASSRPTSCRSTTTSSATGSTATTSSPTSGQLSGLWDGNRNGIPNANDARGIIYRTDLYEAAGVSIPKTWDEYNTTPRR